jgi:hypothetical protein
MSEELEHLVSRAASAADMVAFTPEFQTMTGAEQCRAFLQRGLEALIANGLISVTPMDEWPEYFVSTPPYMHPFKMGLPKE